MSAAGNSSYNCVCSLSVRLTNWAREPIAQISIAIGRVGFTITQTSCRPEIYATHFLFRWYHDWLSCQNNHVLEQLFVSCACRNSWSGGGEPNSLQAVIWEVLKVYAQVSERIWRRCQPSHPRSQRPFGGPQEPGRRQPPSFPQQPPIGRKWSWNRPLCTRNALREWCMLWKDRNLRLQPRWMRFWKLPFKLQRQSLSCFPLAWCWGVFLAYRYRLSRLSVANTLLQTTRLVHWMFAVLNLDSVVLLMWVIFSISCEVSLY